MRRTASSALATGAVLATGVVLLGLTGGCTTAGYLGQAVQGHLALMQQSRPVEDWLADTQTPQALRAQLQLAQRLREFAVHELGLPDNRSYRRFAAIGRPAVVWNVVAAPELSLRLKTWCVPVAGCVSYRGYFDRAAAQALADELRGQGWEVYVYGVPAYSTLGRTDWLGGDPLLDTFVHWPESELARLLFHELAHQVVYVADDTEFNESYATAVERLGVRRWLQQPGRDAARAEHERVTARRADFLELAARHRERLQALYDRAIPDDDKRAGKAALAQRLREELQQLKSTRWGGFAGYDPWVAAANNASVGLQAAYHRQVPAFERLFEQQRGDFARFHAEVRRLAALPRAQRDATLAALATSSVADGPVPRGGRP